MVKDAAILDFSNPQVRRMVLEHIRRLEGPHWFSVRKARKQRSLQQNAYLWGVVYPPIRTGLEEAWGERLSLEEVHEWLKMRFNSKILVDRRTGEIKGRRPSSTATLNTAEFSEYVEKLIRFAAEHLGVEVPSAQPLYQEKASA